VYILHATMSHALRKRIPGLSSTPSESRDESPAKAEEVVLAPKSKVHHGKTRKRRNGLIFFLGGLFGILVAGFFAGRSDLIDFPEFSELSMDSLLDVLPAGFVNDARDLAVFIFLLEQRTSCKGLILDREEKGRR
jgi:phospholipid:diacylglycerol acyltransferase